MLSIACNPKELKDLRGYYSDEHRISVLKITQEDSIHYKLSNQTGHLMMTRFGDTLVGITQLKDTIKMKFHSNDSISYHFWNTVTPYYTIDSLEAESIYKK